MKWLCQVVVIIVSFSVISSNLVSAAKAIPTENIPELAVEKADVEGTLLFSDSPETVNRDGILYSDTVIGKVRLLCYHVNGMAEPRKLAVVLENEAGESADITINNYAIGGPSTDYLHVGKTTQQDYFGDKRVAFFRVPKKGQKLLSSDLSKIKITTDQLVYGVFDFTAAKPVKVTVLMMPANENPLQFIKTAKVLPKDSSRLRGTFAGMNRLVRAKQIYHPIRDGIMGITLADGKLDGFRKGIDATDGSIVENTGNYGVLYKIEVPTQENKKLRYYLNPRGGYYAGAMRVIDAASNRQKMIKTPPDKPFFSNDTLQEVAYLGTYSSEELGYLEFSPPGASNLPARLILVPENY